MGFFEHGKYLTEAELLAKNFRFMETPSIINIPAASPVKKDNYLQSPHRVYAVEKQLG